MKPKHWIPPLSALIIYGLWHMATDNAPQQLSQNKQSSMELASQIKPSTESLQAHLSSTTKKLSGDQWRSILRKKIVQRPAIDPHTGHAQIGEEYRQNLHNILPQMESPTHIKTPVDGDFHYRSDKEVTFSIQSIANIGIIRPHVRFTVENSRGNTLLESSTDASGKYTGKWPLFHKAILYVRFYGAGITQDKSTIQLTGAAQ